MPQRALALALPDGYDARWSSVPEDRSLIERWTSRSPDATVYNSPAYVEFARAQNGRAELLWLARDGNPMLGLPLHPVGDSRFTTGYSGLMFADGTGDGPLRRGVTALLALLGANERRGFQVLQSVQSPAHDDPARIAMLAFLLDRQGLSAPPLYSRVLDLDPIADGGAAAPDVGHDLLLDQGLEPYEPELRNQIRQAVRRGLHATCSLPATDAELQEAYRDFLALHGESWLRTGMTPHESSYWIALARAIIDGGGRDMIIYARDGEGRALAAVTCHLRSGRALYWAGASSEEGLSSRANPLCLHAAIQACRQLGVRHFELGRMDARERSEKELAITRYKAQFGGGLVRVGGFQTQPPVLAVALRRVLALLGGARRRPPAAATLLDAQG
ncbi:MAG: Acetyltransferase domain [Solirubrobacteraceae bacterium]|nr:Acetyltransferase domain [Solirubrobacteraceae bacterium]